MSIKKLKDTIKEIRYLKKTNICVLDDQTNIDILRNIISADKRNL
jgi:hypothetical protein